MKKLLLFLTIIFLSSRLMAQHLVITYDATKGTSGLGGATNVYIHSGANDTTIAPVSGACWHCVIGNWGADDGVGKMTNIGTDLWQIDIPDAWAYYQAATGCDFAGTTTVKCVGMVFRDAAGALTGKDKDNADIFVDLSGASPLVFNSDLTPFDGVTVVASPVGIGTITPIKFGVQCYPNPINTIGTVDYTLDKSSSKVTFSIYDVTGRQLMQIARSNEGRGNHRINFSAENLSNGLYFYSLKADGRVVADRFAVTRD